MGRKCWSTANRIAQLRDFIDTRCEDELLSNMEDCYDVTPFTLTLEIVGMGDER